MKRPSFQFYPGDWLSDTALRSCSVGARGLWIDMLCLMNDGTPYGYLKVNHKVILPPNLARILGATFQETEGWLRELAEANVYSVDDAGCIYSRRMVRDEEIRVKRAAGGIKGGNPVLITHKKKVNLPPNLPPTFGITPSSSSSSSSVQEKESTKKSESVLIPESLRAIPCFENEWNEFRVHRRRKRAAMTPHAENLILKKLAQRPEEALPAIHLCLERGWQGFEWAWLDNQHQGNGQKPEGKKESNPGWAGDYLEERKGHAKPDWAK